MKADLNIPEITGVSAFVFMLAAGAVFLSEIKKIKISVLLIFSVSVIIRLVFLNSEPSLSDDIHRYVFDGKILLSSMNPYSDSPLRAADLYPGMKNLASRVNHPDLVTIYPPAAQLVFAAGAFIGGMNGIRLLIILLDSLSILVMIRIAMKAEIPSSRIILYAWNPLVVMETASSGHIDSAAVFFLILSIYMLTACAPDKESRQIYFASALRFFAAGVAFTFSFLIKLLPVIFLPICLIYAGYKKSMIFISGFIAAVILLVVPFLPDIQNVLKTLDVYARNWEFSGFIFRELRQTTGNGNMARIVIMAVFALFALGIYGQAFQKKTSNGFDAKSFFRSIYILCLVFLLLTPTLHPWYAVYLASIFPFVPGASGICMTFAVLLSYRVLIPYRLTGQWTESDLVAMLIFAAPVVASSANFLMKAIFYRDSACKHRKLTS
ncbi:hypothetical protein [Desulforegula conservatrix]|uniref:hypothetical protein n=1 Tax=Desulforegula conservatrix TaxID=153026 RepID=UPI0004162D9B|nr:hypothetical protein [Desulforegula conservatrix]